MAVILSPAQCLTYCNPEQGAKLGSIPLVALQVKQPEPPPDLVGQYGRLLALKQQQQIAPLQQQQAQQSVQEGQLDIHAKQVAARDADAMSAAMQQWGQPKAGAQPDNLSTSYAVQNPQASAAQPSPGAPATGSASMPNYDDLIELARRNGASFNAIKGLQTSILDMKDKASTIVKNDAQTGQYNANAMKAKNGMVIDALSGALNAPDAQLPQQVMQTAQELAGKQLIDPQHIQLAQQIAQQAQSGDVPGARQQLTMYIKSLGGYNQILTDAQKKAELSNTEGKQDPNSSVYSPSPAAVAMGTAPGAAQIQAGETKQAATKAAAEAAARQPFEMSLARQRQALSQGDPNAAGQLLVDGDATLSQLKARGSTPEFIQSALQAAKQISGGKYNAQQAEANFKVAESPAQLAFFGSAKSLTDPGGTLDQLAEIGKQLPGGKFPALNKLADWEKAATGTGPIAQYASTALGIADDYAKVVGGGVGTDTARQAALDLVPKSASPEARAAAIQGIRGTIHSQMNSRIGKNPILQRMYGEENQAATAPAPTPPPGATHIVPGSDGHNHYTDGKNDLGIAP